MIGNGSESQLTRVIAFSVSRAFYQSRGLEVWCLIDGFKPRRGRWLSVGSTGLTLDLTIHNPYLPFRLRSLL